MSTATPRPRNGDVNARALRDERPDSMIRRSWHAMTDILSPFSSSALASLPRLRRPVRYHRADGIPETEQDDNGQWPTVQDYHAISSAPKVRVPKKVPTPVKVEAKVWFANERTWVGWLDLSIVIGTLALALLNASKDPVARNFAYVYALISVGVLIYGYSLYQHRISMIRRRDPGHFDMIAGPVVVSLLLFFAVLANFVIRGYANVERAGMSVRNETLHYEI
ncbi:hypothetical protein PC9H_009424 [Pleurotus ostreatus]|uniref:DUF202 domain-containing protein n=1 Tax=Pleurotus ostreatus TaxID=5322 RepID=A0A8H7DS22_PLEOS|nr:uncharacterized protein PC9H_009424 [Pleurotus ostreatus]KAF7424121.1 hypothetical protein PC9H_009424 [Pleurotus ostreatus]